MALNAPYYTRTAKLHEEAKVPMIAEFIQKNSDKFYDKASEHENVLIKPLGNYTAATLPFRVKHKLPRAIK